LKREKTREYYTKKVVINLGKARSQDPEKLEVSELASILGVPRVFSQASEKRLYFK
jgi:hypothetical protein